MNWKHSLKKLLALTTTFALFVGMNQHVLVTAALFSDREETVVNQLVSGGVDLTIAHTVTAYTPIIAGEAVSFNADFRNVGSLDFDYDEIYQYVSGDEVLCQQLELTVTDGGSTVYHGLLKDYVHVFAAPLNSGTAQNYAYEVAIPDDTEDIYIDMSCTFDFSSNAYLPSLNTPLVGFWDQENFTVTVSSGVWQSCRQGSETWAHTVTTLLQGMQKGGSSVLPERSVADNALFKPDGNVLSLGVNGTVTFELKYPAAHQSGADIAIHEVTPDRETAPLERAKVEVSFDNIHWYFVGDVTNKDGADGVGMVDISSTGLPWIKYVRLTDVTDFASLASDADGYDIDAVAGLSALCNTPEQIACQTIAGTKRNTETNTGLSNWEMVVHPTLQEPEQTLSVVANNPNTVGSMTLENDRTYLVEVSGTWMDGVNRLVDARFSSTDNWTSHGDVGTEAGRDSRQLDLIIDDVYIDWGTYNSAHVYKTIIAGTGNPLSLQIFDQDNDPVPPTWYLDNNGSLTVRITDVTDQIVTTNENGEYSKAVCGTNFQIIEIQQDGWVQELPSNPSYYHVDIRTLTETDRFDFGNRQLRAKIVINEVYYDVDPAHGNDGNSSQSDEWVELYNPNDYAVNLKDWTLADNGQTRIISHRNVYIPSHGYAVIAKAAQTWTYWSIPSMAVTIELGNIIGNGLANGGDRLRLTNNLGELVDAVSWGTDVSQLNPSVDDVAEGHSIARKPAGFDTDSKTDWMDTHAGSTPAGPNPGTNPHQQTDPVEPISTESPQQPELTPTHEPTPTPTIGIEPTQPIEPTPTPTQEPMPVEVISPEAENPVVDAVPTIQQPVEVPNE